MIIGIDARATLASAAGRGRVVSCLIRQLAKTKPPVGEITYRLYHDGSNPTWLESELVEWQSITAREPFWHIAAARDANRTCDVFISTNSYLTPRFLKIPTVVIVYDLITFQRQARPRLRSRLIERLTLRGAVKKAATLIAISKATAEDLCAQYPAARPKTIVAQLAADDRPASDRTADELERTRERYGLAKHFILIAGTIEPRKNIPRLIAACAGLDDELQVKYPLVVVGKRGWQTKAIEAGMRSLGDRVKTLGFVPDEDLFDLYRLCSVFCYPSLYEGFGLPVLEAMQCGAPVITSDVSSLPEVGGDAAYYVDPLEVESIRAGLELVLTDSDRRQEMSRRGIERAAQFSWSSFAEAVLTVAAQAGAKS